MVVVRPSVLLAHRREGILSKMGIAYQLALALSSTTPPQTYAKLALPHA